MVNNVRVFLAGGGAETTSLAVRRVLHLEEKTVVILSQKIWTVSLYRGDLGGIEIS